MSAVPVPTKEYSVNIADASYPKPFYQGLEFNSPAHGSWNIVHIGMLLPEARQIYVCADNCMRGVVLTAAEMNASDRFSFVILDEEDMTMGNLEEVTIKGVSECIEKLDSHPPVILLFTVCVHHFLGCDLDYVYKKLREMYPDIFFARCYMDPLLQKTKPAPDQKLRMAMYDPIKPLSVNANVISLIGSELPQYKSSDIYRIIEIVSGVPAANINSFRFNPILNSLSPDYFTEMETLSADQSSVTSVINEYKAGLSEATSSINDNKADLSRSASAIDEERPNLCHAAPANAAKTANYTTANGIALREIATCADYNEYLSMGESALFIADYPGALMGLKQLGERLNRPYLYIPMCFGYDEITKEWHALAKAVFENCIRKDSSNDTGTFVHTDPDLSDSSYDNGLGLSGSDKSGRFSYEQSDIAEAIELSAKNEIENCELAIRQAKAIIGGTEIRIDQVFHPRPLGLARLLIEHGFNVSTVYLDVISPEELPDFEWLREHMPMLKLCSTVQVEGRTNERNSKNVLAIGQKAAWFSGSDHFVNAVHGAGLFGFDGIIRLMKLMTAAFKEKKDAKKLITLKGWGCSSCV